MSIGSNITGRSLTSYQQGLDKDANKEHGAIPVRRELPTKHASPRRLLEELKALLRDDADIKIEVQHNVYMIESNQDFDLQTLYLNCRHTDRRGSNSTSSESG